LEPVSGFEPLTCRLQEVRFVAICALTALMPHVIALMALAELGFSGGSSHDSSHAAKQQLSRSCNAALIQRLLTNPAPGRHRSGRILSPPTAVDTRGGLALDGQQAAHRDPVAEGGEGEVGDDDRVPRPA
jgi:hypothetical protein